MTFYVMNYHEQEGRTFLYAQAPLETVFPERKGLIEYCGVEVFDSYSKAREAYPLLPATANPPVKMQIVWIT